MSAFNGITFTPLRDSDGYRYPWRREKHWSREHYPDTGTDEVQFGGQGNAVLEVECLIDSDSDVTSLQALINGTGYTLVHDGATYNTVRLVDETMKRRPWAAEWRGTLTFEREV